MKSFRFFSLSDLWVAISSSKSKRKVYWNNLLKPLLILSECVRFEEMSLGDDIYLTLPTVYIPGALCTSSFNPHYFVHSINYTHEVGISLFLFYK